MDMIYNANTTGLNVFSYYFSTEINPAYFLVDILSPCENFNKTAILSSTSCDGYHKIEFDSVSEGDEDLLNGDIYFSSIGTWSFGLYIQDNPSNTDFQQAEFIEDINIQINYG